MLFRSPLDLAAEIAARKGGLKKVETKEYVPPALRKEEDKPVSTGNAMQNELLSILKKKKSNQSNIDNNNQNNEKTEPEKSTNSNTNTSRPMGMSMGMPMGMPMGMMGMPRPGGVSSNTSQPQKNISIPVKKEEPKPVVNAPPPKMGKGGVPIPPPIPKVVPIVSNTKSKPETKSKVKEKPLDLAAEIAARKGGLKKVETKEYVPPALKKPGENNTNSTSSSVPANSFFAQIAGIKLKKIEK